MSGREAERLAILTYVKSILVIDWGPAAWPNIAFEVPNNTRWLTVEINDYGTDRASIGRNYLKRYLGSLQIDLYSPKGMGSAENRIATDFLENLFDMKTLALAGGELLQFESPPSSRGLGVVSNDSGNWHRRVFEANYHHDSVVTK